MLRRGTAGATGLAPLLPIRLGDGPTVDVDGLLDTGAAVNVLPWSVGLSTLAVIPVWRSVYAASASPFDAVSAALVASLLSLAILEHWFLVLPLPSELLWKWGMVSREGANTARSVRTEPVEVPR